MGILIENRSTEIFTNNWASAQLWWERQPDNSLGLFAGGIPYGRKHYATLTPLKDKWKLCWVNGKTEKFGSLSAAKTHAKRTARRSIKRPAK